MFIIIFLLDEATHNLRIITYFCCMFAIGTPHTIINNLSSCEALRQRPVDDGVNISPNSYSSSSTLHTTSPCVANLSASTIIPNTLPDNIFVCFTLTIASHALSVDGV
jgi:hypothetical protein